MKCPTCGEDKRSSEANRRYWSLVNLVSNNVKPNNQQFSQPAWHEYFKSRFLGMKEIHLPSGQMILIPVSTAELKTSEFCDYMSRVEVWAAEHGVWLDE
jgi:hypothetical protein